MTALDDEQSAYLAHENDRYLRDFRQTDFSGVSLEIFLHILARECRFQARMSTQDDSSTFWRDAADIFENAGEQELRSLLDFVNDHILPVVAKADAAAKAPKPPPPDGAFAGVGADTAENAPAPTAGEAGPAPEAHPFPLPTAWRHVAVHLYERVEAGLAAELAPVQTALAAHAERLQRTDWRSISDEMLEELLRREFRLQRDRAVMRQMRDGFDYLLRFLEAGAYDRIAGFIETLLLPNLEPSDRSRMGPVWEGVAARLRTAQPRTESPADGA
jgi:hypothetical protein